MGMAGGLCPARQAQRAPFEPLTLTSWQRSEGASSKPQGVQQSTRDRAEVRSEAVQAARTHTPHELF